MIISDRMADSSIVYQGYGRGLDKQLLKTINTWAMQDVTPDLTLYVHIDAATATQRFTNRNTQLSRFEQENTQFFEKLINGYNQLYQDKKNVIIIDGTKTPEDVTAQAKDSILQWIKNHN